MGQDSPSGLARPWLKLDGTLANCVSHRRCVPAVDSSCSLQGIQFTCVLHNRGFGTPPLEGVPARWLVTKSPREFGFTCDVLLTEDSRTPTRREEKELDKATSRDLLEGGETVGDGRKGLSGGGSEDGS
jgi:hypothetical protein